VRKIHQPAATTTATTAIWKTHASTRASLQSGGRPVAGAVEEVNVRSTIDVDQR